MLLETSKDWTIHTFSDLVKESQLGTTLRGSENNTSIPLIKMGNLEWGGLNLKKLEQLDNSFVDDDLLLRKGDFLFNTRNTLELVGKSTVWPDNIRATFDNNINRIRFKNFVNPFFMELFLNHGKGKQAINRLAVGSTSVAAVYWKDVAKLKLTLPTFSEQQEIVEIISAWNQMISKAQNLIEEKQKQKKALMQRLLTGKHRFPEFEGQAWQEVELGDLFKRVRRKNEENNKAVVTISGKQGFVLQSNYFKKNIASSTLDNYFLLHKGEFAYNKSYSNGYPMGAIKRLNTCEKGVVTTLYICFALKDEKNFCPHFFEQFFEYGLMNRGLRKIANEGGRAHGLLNVTPSDFFKLKMTIPSHFEQEKIAAVLSTADEEINLLTQKLEAYQAQKKGLMQQLLTGKKRVKTTQKEAA